jgi:hypothetical protein
MAPGSQGLELEPGLQSSRLGLGLSRDGDCQHRESCSNPTHDSYQSSFGQLIGDTPPDWLCYSHKAGQPRAALTTTPSIRWLCPEVTGARRGRRC